MAIHPIVRGAVLMRHGNDENEVATNGIAQRVRKPLEPKAPNVTRFQRVHQRHVGDALCGGAHLLPECAAQIGANRPIPGAGLVKFEPGKLRKSNALQSWPKTSSAEYVLPRPASKLAKRRTASSPQMRSISGSGLSRLCMSWSTI